MSELSLLPELSLCYEWLSVYGYFWLVWHSQVNGLQKPSPNIVQKVRGLLEFVFVCQELAFVLIIVALVG